MQACLWDVDTLQMERRRFPGVNELITGNFIRHSRDYYEWRLKDRARRLAITPLVSGYKALKNNWLGNVSSLISTGVFANSSARDTFSKTLTLNICNIV